MPRYSANELKSMAARGESKTDLARVDAMTEDELERAIAEDPDSDPPVDWSRVKSVMPANKQGVFLRLDPQVLDYFREGGPGYQTRINAVLKGYVAEIRARQARKSAG